jgi:large subunit ribosomal protein L29
MKNAEIRLLSDEEIKAKLAEAHSESMNLRFQMVSGQLKDTSKFKQNKRLIARFETMLQERTNLANTEGEK